MERLCALTEALKMCSDDGERLELLNRDPRVAEWFEKSPLENHFSPEDELIMKSLVAIGQEIDAVGLLERLRAMLNDLRPVETFYKQMGGIVGYHFTLLSFLAKKDAGEEGIITKYHRPPGIDISNQDDAVATYILEGIVSLPFLAEIYPVGGAADRLKFCDPASGQMLPAAKMPFCGYTLLEGLIRDVQAREYLYYKLFGEQVVTPIAMMTSLEKDNHRHILELCEEKRWFGRPRESFRFFCQPAVPTMDREGKWCQMGTLKWLMKPGGHGVIWKVAESEGIFDWLSQQGRTKLLVRQINNPIAGVDNGLLAFCGIGFRENKLFGFASCPRQVGSAEGVNILLEKKDAEGSHFCLTNIEYCDFSKFSIEDVPVQEGSAYSLFPSNTNLLFADISAVASACLRCPIPGMLVNLKAMSFVDEEGVLREQEIARLESTMQNIADCFGQTEKEPVSVGDLALNTYLTYNLRRKTISTTKKLYQVGNSLLETPEGCFYDRLCNAYELLTQHCKMEVPEVPNAQAYIEQGPSFFFSYHPALGPLFSIIGQKLQGGALNARSELVLEIAEASIEQLHLTGSLRIVADQVMGGCVRMRNVTVENRGIDPDAHNVYWKEEITRFEQCEIVLHGYAHFIAENVALRGALKIEVDDGFKVTAYEEGGELKFKKEPLSGSEKQWIYFLEENGSIRLD